MSGYCPECGNPICMCEEIKRAERPHVQSVTPQQKREWVGLTVNEARKFYEKYTNREELIYAIDKFLEEKNSG